MDQTFLLFHSLILLLLVFKLCIYYTFWNYPRVLRYSVLVSFSFHSLCISVWEISIDIIKFTLSLVRVCNILISYLNLNLIYIKIKSILYIWFLFWCLLCLFGLCVCVCVCLLDHFVILLWTQFWFWTIKPVQTP